MPFFSKTDVSHYNRHIFFQYGVLLLMFFLVVWSIAAAAKSEKEKFIDDVLGRCQVLEIATADILNSGAKNWISLIQERIDALQQKDSNLVRLSVIAKSEQDTYLHVASSLPSRIGKPAHQEDLEAIDSDAVVILEEPYLDTSALDITYPVHSFDGSIVALLGYTVKREPALGISVILGILSLVSLMLLSLFHILQTRMIIRQGQTIQQNLNQKLEAEKQLHQKRKMEAVGYMAGGMAHNFNNNLGIILGNIELAQFNIHDPKTQELLKNAKTAIHRSRDLVKQIITYSRKGIQDKFSMRLLDIIDETITLLSSTLPTTINLQKSISPACNSAFIHADATQIQEILVNLCNNAVQAMNERGELKISLETVELSQKDIPGQYDEEPGCYAKMTVQDTGCGISAEILDKIFDPFFTTKEEYEGAGIGLATVQGIIVQHGGIIKVDSVPGQGTTFTLYFPIVSMETDKLKNEDSSLPRGTERILFVDDDEMLACLGEQLLTQHGYQVTKTSESSDALMLFSANADRFNVVLTDQTMPNLTGEELIQEVKKISPDMPTILCTGYSSKIDENKAKELGINAFLMKPLDLPILLQTVRRVLDGE